MFSILQYNILQVSLGSSCIPWVLNFPAELDEDILARLKQWQRAVAFPEYEKNFFKHFVQDDSCKVALRQMWACVVDGPEDIPEVLQDRVIFVDTDTIHFVDENGCEHTAKTFRGLLRSSFPDIGDDVFTRLMEIERNFAWENRGPKLFETVMSEFQGCASTTHAKPDILALIEYDAHDFPTAEYLGKGTSKITWKEAMNSQGYDGLVMNEPFECDRSGIGIFWKRSEFEPAHGLSKDAADRIFCGNSAFEGAAKNFDMHEHWHKRVSTTEFMYCEMPKPSRFNCCFIKLRHKSTAKVLLLVCCHLMTTSADCSQYTKYPGEVRANEIAYIRKIVESEIENSDIPIDGVIFTGDFNTNLVSNESVNEVYVFKGVIKSTLEGEDEYRVDTGCVEVATEDENIGDLEMQWKSCTLREAFAPLHKWGANVGLGPNQVYSSFNAKRCSWIDYMWYSPSSLEVVELKLPSNLSKSPIPNAEFASDHIQIGAVFKFSN